MTVGLCKLQSRSSWTPPRRCDQVIGDAAMRTVGIVRFIGRPSSPSSQASTIFLARRDGTCSPQMCTCKRRCKATEAYEGGRSSSPRSAVRKVFPQMMAAMMEWIQRKFQPSGGTYSRSNRCNLARWKERVTPGLAVTVLFQPLIEHPSRLTWTSLVV